ncbi:unnamed protein product [Amoebophrya sp. A120]|nr:unnamed protein product [Amoebophrya sp. A120]|eukprot:GSA120T00015150001.1
MPNREHEMEMLRRPLRLSPIGKELRWPSERAASSKLKRVEYAACFALMLRNIPTRGRMFHVPRCARAARGPKNFLLCAHRRCRSARAQRAPREIFAICRSHWRARLLFYLTPLTPLKTKVALYSLGWRQTLINLTCIHTVLSFLVYARHDDQTQIP